MKSKLVSGLKVATALALGVAAVAVGHRTQAAPASEATPTKVEVVFSGGHETDPRDRGRPVMLVAAALGVPTEVFRAAFSHVRPAPAGTQPDPDQVRRNKAALLAALGPYGVTNEKLDTVSNYYRYVRRRGELWPTTPATTYALVNNGTITGFVVTNGGSGYSSPPTSTVPGFQAGRTETQLAFSQTFDHNGAVAKIVAASDTQH